MSKCDNCLTTKHHTISFNQEVWQRFEDAVRLKIQSNRELTKDQLMRKLEKLRNCNLT